MNPPAARKSALPLEKISLLNLEGASLRLREIIGDGVLIIFLRHLA
jgi:hypothetical protein